MWYIIYFTHATTIVIKVKKKIISTNVNTMSRCIYEEDRINKFILSLLANQRIVHDRMYKLSISGGTRTGLKTVSTNSPRPPRSLSEHRCSNTQASDHYQSHFHTVLLAHCL